MSVKTSAATTGATIEARPAGMEIIAIDDSPATRDIRVVVVNDPAAVMPIESPMVPAPAEPAE